MDRALKRAVARVEMTAADGEPTWGTAFLVGEKQLLTANHVVTDMHAEPSAPHPGPISVRFFEGPHTKATRVPGMADPVADWILLACEDAPDAPPFALAELDRDAVPWEAFGYPLPRAKDGMVVRGKVTDIAARFRGVDAIQLFGDEAGAGGGAPVEGLSGAPCVHEGAVFGLVRASLADALGDPRRNLAGTLYATPIGAVLAIAGERVASVVRAALGTPSGEPFPGLRPFLRADAPVFFGRDRDVQRLWTAVRSPTGPPVVLLFGASGVGKSSLLEAGLAPRLEAGGAGSWRAARRDRKAGLAAAIPAMLGAQGPAGEAWRAQEAESGHPWVLLVDQVEEVFTQPFGTTPEDELAAFVDQLLEIFAKPPRGRIVVSFRKEWLSEIEDAFTRLACARVALRRLDRRGVIEVVTGIDRFDDLRRQFPAHLEPGLALGIAKDLLQDPESPVAPVLQILMRRMWEEAPRDDDGRRALTVRHYAQIRESGLHLDAFLDHQLASMPEAHRDAVESGRVLDLLAAHTTRLRTARALPTEAVANDYGEVSDLVSALIESYLLAALEDGSTRLAHDTLAAVVRARFETSDRPAQRARRLLEIRAVDWADGRHDAPLDSADLALVEFGIADMRRPTRDELRLVEASRAAETRRRWVVTAARLAFATLGVGLAVLAFFLWRSDREQSLRLAERLFQDAQTAANTRGEVVRALLLADAALAATPSGDPRRRVREGRLWTLGMDGPVATLATGGVPASSLSYDEMPLGPSFWPAGRVGIPAFSAAGDVVIRVDGAGAPSLWHIPSRQRLTAPPSPTQFGAWRAFDPAPALDPNGHWWALVRDDGEGGWAATVGRVGADEPAFVEVLHGLSNRWWTVAVAVTSSGALAVIDGHICGRGTMSCMSKVRVTARRGPDAPATRYELPLDPASVRIGEADGRPYMLGRRTPATLSTYTDVYVDAFDVLDRELRESWKQPAPLVGLSAIPGELGYEACYQKQQERQQERQQEKQQDPLVWSGGSEAEWEQEWMDGCDKRLMVLRRRNNSLAVLNGEALWLSGEVHMNLTLGANLRGVQLDGEMATVTSVDAAGWLQVLDLETGRPLRTRRQIGRDVLTTTQSNGLVTTVDARGQLRQWSVERPGKVHRPPLPTAPEELTWSRRGRWLAMARLVGDSFVLKRWDLRRPDAPPSSRRLSAGVKDLAVDDDAVYARVCGVEECAVVRWAPNDGVIQTPVHDARAFTYLSSPARLLIERRQWTGANPRTELSIRDASDLSERSSCRLPGQAVIWETSARGDLAFVKRLDIRDGTDPVEVWSIARCERLARFVPGGVPNAESLIRVLLRTAVGAVLEDGALTFELPKGACWRVDTGESLERRVLGSDARPVQMPVDTDGDEVVWYPALSPDGRWLAVARSDEGETRTSVEVRDPNSGERLAGPVYLAAKMSGAVALDDGEQLRIFTATSAVIDLPIGPADDRDRPWLDELAPALSGARLVGDRAVELMSRAEHEAYIERFCAALHAGAEGGDPWAIRFAEHLAPAATCTAVAVR